MVYIYCDNKAFQQSGVKGRSRVERLNSLVKELFLLMIKFDFIVHLIWISTHDNVNADHLSREDREAEFLREVYESNCCAPDTVPIRLEGAGRLRVLPEKRGAIDNPEHAYLPVAAAESKSASVEVQNEESKLSVGAAPFVPALLSKSGPVSPTESSVPPLGISDPIEDDGTDYIRRAQAAGGCTTRSRGAGVGVSRGGSLMLILALFGGFCVPEGDCMPLTRIQASMTYSSASLFVGLPLDLVGQVETVLDNRLASSSWRKVQVAVKIWRVVAEQRSWAHMSGVGSW